MTSPPYPRTGVVTLQADHDRPGLVCQTTLHWMSDMSITPEVVEKLVLHALAQGWDPDERGSRFDAGGFDLADHPPKEALVRRVMEG